MNASIDNNQDVRDSDQAMLAYAPGGWMASRQITLRAWFGFTVAVLLSTAVLSIAALQSYRIGIFIVGVSTACVWLSVASSKTTYKE